MANVPLSKGVPQIYVPSLSVPQLKAKHLYVPKLEVPGVVYKNRKKAERLHVKDLGDLLLGNPIKGTLQLQHTLEDYDYGEFKYIPLLNRLVGASLLVKERTLEPISEGKWGEAAINVLESFGNSLDIVANPVKSLMPWAGGGGSEDLLKSMGWAEDEYRKLYQWDTGFFLADLALEVVSDPLNWVSFGGKQVAKTALDVSVDAMRKAITKKIGEEAAKNVPDSILRLFIKEAGNDIMDESGKLVKTIMERLEETRAIYKSDLLKISKHNAKYDELRALIRQYDEAIKVGKSFDLEDAIAQVRFTDGYKHYKAAAQLIKTANKINNAILVASMGINPVAGVGYLVLTRVLTPTFKAIWNNTVIKLKEVDLGGSLNNNPGALKKLNKTISVKNKAAHAEVYKKFERILAKYNIDVEKLQRVFANIINSTPKSKLTNEYVNEAFLKYLRRVVPELRYISADEIFNPEAMELLTGLTEQDIQDLVDAVSEAGVVMSAAKEAMLNNFKKTIDEQMSEFFGVEGKTLEDFSYVDRLEFIENQLLVIPSKSGLKYYRLDELDKYLKRLSKINPDAYVKVTALLDYVGITVDNAKRVSVLLEQIRQGITGAKEELKQLLKASKKGDYITLVNNNKTVATMAKQLKFIQPNMKYGPNVEDMEIYELFTQTTSKNIGDIVEELEATFEKALSIQDELINTITENLDVLTDDLDLFYATLDEMFTYDGSDLVPSELLKSIVDFDLNNATEEGLRQYVTNLQELQSRMKLWKQRILNGNVSTRRVIRDSRARLEITNPKYIEMYPDAGLEFSDGYDKRYLNTILDLENIINTKELDVVIDNLIDLIKTGDDYYRLVVSAQGRFALLEQALLSSVNADLIAEVSKYDSDIRIALERVIVMLRENRALVNTDAAKDLDRILSALDATNNMAALMNYQFTKYNIPKHIQGFIQGEIFNVVFKHKNETINKFALNEEMLTAEFMVNFKKHVEAELYEYFTGVSMEEGIVNPLAQRLDELTTKLRNGTITDAEMVEYDELILVQPDVAPVNQSLYDAFMEDLTENVTNAFKNYIATNRKIQEHTGVELFFYNPIDNKVVASMNSLGLEFDNIIEALSKAGADGEEILHTADFITRVSGNVIQPQVDSAQRAIQDVLLLDGSYEEVSNAIDSTIKETTDEDVVYLLEEGVKKSKVKRNTSVIEYRLKELSEGSIARDITSAFSYIEELNTYYAGLGDVLAYVSVDDFNAFIRATTSFQNAYGWSTSNGFLAVKKDINSAFVKAHKLSPHHFNAEGTEYTLLYNYLKDSIELVDEFAVINKWDIEYMRKSLIEVYRDNFISWGPKNPDEYFALMSDKDILAWDRMTTRGFLDKDTASRYIEIKNKYVSGSIEDQVLKTQDTNWWYNEVHDVNFVEGMTDEDAWNKYIDGVPNKNPEYLNKEIKKDLGRYIKDPESLKQYKADFEQFIKEDIAAYENCQIFGDLEKDTRTVGEILGDEFKKHKTMLESYGINESTTMGSPEMLRFLKEERSQALVMSLYSWNAKQLRSFIDKNTAGILVFVDKKQQFIDKFTEEELSAAGLKIDKLSNDQRILVIHRLDDNMTDVAYEYVQPEYVFKEVQEQITNAFRANRNYFYWDGMDLPDELFTGEMMDLDVYDTMLKTKEFRDILGDVTEQKTYSKMTKEGLNSFYTKKISRPNLAIVGDADAYNDLLDALEDAFKKRNFEPMRMSTRIDKSAWRGSVEAIKRANSEGKYLQLFFNDDYYIGNPMFSRIFENATDAELKDIFKRNEFVACIVRQDSKGRPKVYKIYIGNKKQLADAIKAKAIIVPHEVYRNMVLSVNKHSISNKFINMYRRTIVGTYKTIYLHTLGFPFRNWGDSGIYKNLASTDGLAGFFANFKYEYRAAKMLKQYDDIVHEVLELSKHKTFNRKYLKQVLIKYPKEVQDMFMLIDMFINSSASAGFTKSFKEYLLNFNKANTEFLGYAWEKWYQENVLGNKLMHVIPELNDRIEQISRLGLFLNLIDNGGSYTDAVRTVINTHFDYALKEPGMELLEQIFWFSTFPINNMFYYLNEGITKNPDMLKLQMDMMNLSWNNAGYTWDDVKKSDYLTYNALAGNIRFELLGEQIVLKTGSSVLDFFNLLFNPGNEAIERLNPFIGTILGTDDLSQLNPLSSVGNRIQQFTTGKSYIPSVYATLYTNKFPKKHYIEKAPYVRYAKWNFKPRKIYFRKPDNMKRMRYRFATSNFYFKRGKNLNHWIMSSGSIDPHWYTTIYKKHRFSKKRI